MWTRTLKEISLRQLNRKDSRFNRIQLIAALILGCIMCTTAIAQIELRINAGGADHTDINGHLFVADKAYVAGDFGFVGGSSASTASNIRDTQDDPLYQNRRDGASFSYIFDNMPNGDYEIRLYFAEPTATDYGQRTFDISVEGALVRTAFDIVVFATTPWSDQDPLVPRFVPTVGEGMLRAYSELLTATVTDGQLNIGFDVVAGTDAIVSAIAVRDLPAVPLSEYVDVAPQVGVLFNNDFNAQCGPMEIGSGSAWSDYDNDGDIDLYVTNHGGPNRLYRNDGDTNLDGLPDFSEVAAAASVDDPSGNGHGAVFIDYDNDGDQDLFVTNSIGNELFQNQLIETSSPVFVNVSATAGIDDDGRTITAAWADFDGDGDLDVYLAEQKDCFAGASEDHLYRNNGDGTFSDVTGYFCPGGVAPCPDVEGATFSAGWFDYDNDGDPDLYTVNDNVGTLLGPNVLWRNDGPDGAGGWLFTNVSSSSGAGVGVNGMGLGIGDYDNDGSLDLAFSNVAQNKLLRNLGDGTFEDRSASTGIQKGYVPSIGDPDGFNQNWTWGTIFFDHDNDMLLDLMFVSGYPMDDRPLLPNLFFGNNGDGTFTDLTNSSGLGELMRARNGAIADFDQDGFPDVFASNVPDAGAGGFPSGGVPRLFHNRSVQLGNTNNWLTVTVEGTVSNRDGIGTRLTLTTPDTVIQIREISSGATHGGGDYRAAYFGLGGNVTGDLTVRWPNGVQEDLGTFAANQAVHLVEPQPDEPNIRVNSTSLAFGQVEINTIVDADIIVTNDGAQPLTLNSLTTSNPLFSVVSPATPAVVTAGGGTQNVTIRFSPTAVSNEIGDLDISSNDPDEPLVTLVLSGEGIIGSPGVEYRINSGGADYTDTGGSLFVADKAFVVGDFGYINGLSYTHGAPISGTTDGPLYADLRADLGSITYQFDNLPAGNYDVTLHFTEINVVVGERQFDVSAEGIVVLDNYDIVAAAGGVNIAQQETFNVTVNDGMLNLDFVPVTANHTGIFAIEVVQSSAAQAPSIIAEPQHLSVTAPDAATFSVAASGTGPLSHQWRRNGANIAGATGTSYTLDPTSIADDGASFDVVISNVAGSVTSQAAILTVTSAPEPPTVTVQPASLTVTEPAAATFSVTATGTAPLSYQWRRNGANVAGATGISYTLDPTNVSDDGASFDVVVSNAFGSETSQAAILTVSPAPEPPAITVQPTSVTVTEPAAATFNVTATGTAPLSYQWRRNGANVAGGTGTSYTLDPTSVADDGASFDVVVSNVAGDATSQAAILTVNAAPEPPSISVQPVSVTVTEPAAATFSVTATGTAPLTYQWRRDGGDIGGATGASYTLNPSSVSDDGAGFDVVVNNAFGNETSQVAILTVLAVGAEEIQFTDVTTAAGINVLHSQSLDTEIDFRIGFMAGGAVAEDFDGDGWIDIYFVQSGGGPNRMYMNQRDGTFIDEAPARGADLAFSTSTAASAADYDNDGDIDIVVSVPLATSRLLINDGSGNFTIDSTMLAAGPTVKTMSSSWGDVDNDGLLELAIGQWNGQEFEPQNLFMFRNDGDGILTEYEFRTAPAQDVEIFVPRFADVNNDGLTDLPVNADFFNSQLFLNVGDGQFQNVTPSNGTGGALGGHNEMGVAIADYDNDGDLDWFATAIFDPLNPDGTIPDTSCFDCWGGNRMYRNNGDGTFTDATDIAGVRDGNWGWGAAFGDLDNDGDLDLFHVNGWANPNWLQFNDSPARLFKNAGDGTFSDVAVAAGAGDTGQGRGTFMFDYDNDGDLDIFIMNNQILDVDGANVTRSPAPPALLRNDTLNANNWLKVTLDGTPPMHRDGIGSRVSVTIGGAQQLRELHASSHFLAQGPGRIAHFGVGTSILVDELRAQWVSGDDVILDNVAVNQMISIPSPVGTVSNRMPAVNEDFTASAPGEPNPVEWLIEGAIIPDPGTGITTSFSTDGDKELELRIFDATGTSIIRREIIRVNVVAAAVEFHINAGGPAYTDSAGDLFVADKPFTAGDFGFVNGLNYSHGLPITGTPDPTLYATLRADLGTISYIFDGLAAGDYTVTLHFTELNVALGERQFDVVVEGVVRLDDYEILAAAGGVLTAARTETFIATVTDGQLNIDFVPVTANHTGIFAISVVGAGTP